MLFYYSRYCCNGMLLLMLAATACAGYAYYVNSKRPDDDPKKKNYHPAAILFAPFTLPLLIFGTISIFILRALTYGVFLILFIITLLMFGNSSESSWLENIATKIGNALLKTNTLLIKLFLRPWADEPETI